MTLTVDRYFTKDKGERSVYDLFNWEKTDTDVIDDFGNILFKQQGIEFPTGWSPLAVKMVTSKYFFGENGTPQREQSERQVTSRISDTISKWAVKQGYFDKKGAQKFRDELAYLSLDQRMSFNSPVLFNVGVDRIAGEGGKDFKESYVLDAKGNPISMPMGRERSYPQTSACFIQSVEDTMESIMDLAKKEAMLFKYGSGTGTNLSTLRSSREKLSGGGKPSGPLAYWAFYDKVAGIVKSGGKTRRAAKMNILDISHPDVFEFIESKMREERKARILLDAGVEWKEAKETVGYQNTNISVRVTDEFMQAAETKADWQTTPVHNKDMKDKMPKERADKILRKIAEATHFCGDPGMQFDDTINKWHTCPNSGRINASNPCSEYMFIDDSACNLASHNLMRYLRIGEKSFDASFDIAGFEEAVKQTAIAQDILIDNSSYPTKEIATNSHKFRPLGMGYANLGSLVMSLGLPYTSPEARAVAASITALMTGKVYETSSEMAEKLGAFEEFEKNKEPMLKVMRMHRAALTGIDRTKIPNGLENILDEAEKVWDRVIEKGLKYGFRNAQASVLAPTGTIGFRMDCDTKGVEPEIGLVQTKLMSDGGKLRLVNGNVESTLRRLGYQEEEVKEIKGYISGHKELAGTPHLKEKDTEALKKLRESRVRLSDSKKELEKIGYSSEQASEMIEFLDGHETMEGAPYIKEEHLPIFDCSNKPHGAKRVIPAIGHLEMMAAVQPFLSGAISKTVNLPKEATIDDIERVYKDAWRLGLKAVALYRDESKAYQPLSFAKKEKLEAKVSGPVRRKLPSRRNSVTQKFSIDGHEGYLISGLYEDGTPGELFITMSKEGSTIGGLMDTLGTLTSFALQYGVPLEALVKKLRHQNFEPSGLVFDDPRIKTAKSIPDYIAQFLEIEFLKEPEKLEELKQEKILEEKKVKEELTLSEDVGGMCPICGAQMKKIGNCGEICTSCNHKNENGCGK